MKLVIHNDSELSAAVAEHVVGLCLVESARMTAAPNEKCWRISEEYGVYKSIPPYATSADAVLPLLNKTFCVWSYHTDEIPGRLCADTTRRYEKLHQAFGPFPHAACVVLLQAAGHEVVFT